MPKSAEFILQPDRIPVVLVEPFGPGFGPLLERLMEDIRLQPLECISAMDALSVVRHMPVCLVIAHAGSPADVQQHLSLLKLLGPQIRKRQVRVIITSALLGQEAHERLTVAGCSEILAGDLPLKALLFKVDRHIKALPQPGSATKTDGSAGNSAAGAVNSLSPRTGSSEEKAIEAGVRLVAALEFASDCWIMAGGAKRTSGQWLIKLNGPSPEHGRWISLSDAWQWKPVDPTQDVFITERGAWLYTGGRKPEYHSGLWQFVGTNPSLSFVEKEESYGYKFTLNQKGSLLIARDSPASLAFLRQLRDGTIKRPGKSVQSTFSKPLDVADPFGDIPAHAFRESSSPPKPAVLEKEAPAFSEAPVEISVPVSPRVYFVDALTLASDCWLIEDRHPKRVNERWLVRLLGPGPNSGGWVPQISGADNARKSSPHWSGSVEKWWQWTPTLGEEDPFIREQGSWYFFGLTPHFADGIWSFASSSPELGFYFKGKSYGSKFCSLEGESLQVAQDSGNALSSLPMILDSFEPRVQTLDSAQEDAEEIPENRTVLAQSLPPEEGPQEVEQRVSPSDVPDSSSALARIAATTPPGPSISPLALAFLVSELMAKRGLDRRYMSRRYCEYVSASCGGLNTELWACRQGSQDWACVGTPGQAGEGLYGTLAQGRAGLFEQQGVPVYVTLVRNGEQGMIGALIIGGKGAQGLDPEYTKAAARVAIGLLQSFAEDPVF